MHPPDPLDARRGRAGQRSCQCYTPVSPGLPDVLRARADEQGLHQLSAEGLEPGDKLRIVTGRFAGLDAVFQAHQGADRVRVLLDIVGATTSATIPTGLVVALRAGGAASG